MNNLIAAQLFILRLKPLLAEHKVVFDPRNKKTQKFLMEEGMNTDDVFAYLEKLEPSNYYDGPKEDHNGRFTKLPNIWHAIFNLTKTNLRP